MKGTKPPCYVCGRALAELRKLDHRECLLCLDCFTSSFHREEANKRLDIEALTEAARRRGE